MTIRAPPIDMGNETPNQLFSHTYMEPYMAAAMIKGYLPKGVTNSKHRGAREAVGFIKTVVETAGGTGMKVEVMMGTLFLTFDGANVVAALKKALFDVKDVTVEEPSEAMLIYIKEQARDEAAELDRKAAEALAKKVA